MHVAAKKPTAQRKKGHTEDARWVSREKKMQASGWQLTGYIADKQWACIFQIPILVKSRSVAETIASVGPTESVHPNRNHQATLTSIRILKPVKPQPEGAD